MVAKATIVHGRFVQSHVTGHLLVKSSLPRCLYLHIARHMIMAAKNNFNALHKAWKICHSVSRNAGGQSPTWPSADSILFPGVGAQDYGQKASHLGPQLFLYR
jgi:hypothetical protein